MNRPLFLRRTGRLSLAGALLPLYYLAVSVLVLGWLLWPGRASAAINDAGWIDCGATTDFCGSGPGAWIRRGQGDAFVTYFQPTVTSGKFCQAYEANEYGTKGFGSRADVAGDRCFYQAATGTAAPDGGLGFVDTAGFISPLCVGGVACDAPDDEEPPASSPVPSGALGVEQALTLLLAAVVLFFAFFGYSVGVRR